MSLLHQRRNPSIQLTSKTLSRLRIDEICVFLHVKFLKLVHFLSCAFVYAEKVICASCEARSLLGGSEDSVRPAQRYAFRRGLRPHCDERAGRTAGSSTWTLSATNADVFAGYSPTP